MKNKDYVSTGERTVTGRLPNGLKVIVVPKLDYSKVYAFFATNYGGADRRFKLGGKWTDTPSGVAHFLEHKMFDQKDGTNALTTLSANGASPNAFTSSDITAYHFECTDKFEDNLRILLNFVTSPYFTEESVSKEQGIIGQEIRMMEDNPDFALYYDLMKALLKENPIRDPVAGTVDSISHITPEILYGCHSVFYNPSNMVLCVAGDVDPESVFKIAEEIVIGKAGEEPERDYGEKESLTPEKAETERKMEVGMPMFLIGAKAEAPDKGAEYLKLELTAELALEILAGRSSPFYAELYGQGRINANFSAEFEISAGVSYTAIGGESRDPLIVRERLQKEIALLAIKGPDEAMFSRTKKAAAGRKLRELNSFDSICYNTARGYFRGYDYFETSQVLSEITPNDVKEFLSKYLAPERLALSVINPK